MYVCDNSDYNPDNGVYCAQNAMHDSLTLFDSICNHPSFTTTLGYLLTYCGRCPCHVTASFTTTLGYLLTYCGRCPCHVTASFTTTPTILFLNKKDIFLTRIQHIPLTVCFVDYKGLLSTYWQHL